MQHASHLRFSLQRFWVTRMYFVFVRICRFCVCDAHAICVCLSFRIAFCYVRRPHAVSRLVDVCRMFAARRAQYDFQHVNLRTYVCNVACMCTARLCLSGVSLASCCTFCCDSPVATCSAFGFSQVHFVFCCMLVFYQLPIALHCISASFALQRTAVFVKIRQQSVLLYLLRILRRRVFDWC